LALARVKHELHDDLRAAGLLKAVGSDRIFMTLPTAVDAFHRWSGCDRTTSGPPRRAHGRDPDADGPPTDA
jgi:hypothetical protein